MKIRVYTFVIQHEPEFSNMVPLVVPVSRFI